MFQVSTTETGAGIMNYGRIGIIEKNAFAQMSTVQEGGELPTSTHTCCMLHAGAHGGMDCVKS